MKKKKISTIVIIFILLIIVALNSIAATGTATVDSLRVREKPSASSEIVEMLSVGQKVEILGTEGDWYKIKFNNVIGYVSKTYLSTTDVITGAETTTPTTTTPTETTPETPSATPSSETNTEMINENLSQKNVSLAKDAEVYLVPSVFSIKTSTIKANTTIKVLFDFGSWIKIEYNGQEGWITKNLISAGTSTPAANNTTDTTTAGASSIGVINVDTAVVRSGANKTANQIDTLDRNDEVTIVEELGEWYHIKKDNLDGYVASRLITKK
jgi:probable enterotoxin B